MSATLDATTIPAYITAALRFPDDEILCRGDRWQQGCAAADGEAAYAIHTFEGKHYCGYHSPFDNKYAPCRNCGEKPALKPQSTEADPVCDDCMVKIPEREHVVDAPTLIAKIFHSDEALAVGDWVLVFEEWHEVIDADEIRNVEPFITHRLTAEQMRALTPSA